MPWDPKTWSREKNKKKNVRQTIEDMRPMEDIDYLAMKWQDD